MIISKKKGKEKNEKDRKEERKFDLGGEIPMELETK